MRSIALASALFVGASLYSPAEAQRFRSAHNYGYIFGEYDYYTGAGSSLNGGGIGAGWRFNRYLSAQLGGQYFRKSGVDITNSYLEGMVHLPLAPSFSIYASVGGAYAQSSSTPFSPSSSSSGYRAGVGAEYWMGRSWGLRASFHRQNAGGVADDIGVGIGYRF